MPVDAENTDYEQRARLLMEDRIAAIRALGATRQALADKRAELDAAEVNDATAFAAALRIGWTAVELKRVGFDAPVRKMPGRPRGTSSKPTPTAAVPAQLSRPSGGHNGIGQSFGSAASTSTPISGNV